MSGRILVSTTWLKMAQRAGHHHDGHHGGDQATDAANPEALEVDASGLSDFVEQQAARPG